MENLFEEKIRIRAYDQLVRHIVNLNLISPNKISLETKIEKDLGLSGDDAVDFIEEFADEFQIDIQFFKYDNYFKKEGFSFQLKTRSDVSLKKLLNAIITGKLD